MPLFAPTITALLQFHTAYCLEHCLVIPFPQKITFTPIHFETDISHYCPVNTFLKAAFWTLSEKNRFCCLCPYFQQKIFPSCQFMTDFRVNQQFISVSITASKAINSILQKDNNSLFSIYSFHTIVLNWESNAS